MFAPRLLALCVPYGLLRRSHNSPKLQPDSPHDVLSFWFGAAWSHDRHRLSDSNYIATMMPLWFSFRPGGEVTDAEKEQNDRACREFERLIALAGDRKLTSKAWTSPDGLFAQMLLCDQFARNAFRGTARAFQYDHQGLEFARRLVDMGEFEHYEMSQVMFLSTPLQHSETLEDHDKALILLEYCKEKWGEEGLTATLTKSITGHREVIAKFGRYPHRNKKLGRQSTSEEEAWLASDDLPGWAKSQK